MTRRVLHLQLAVCFLFLGAQFAPVAASAENGSGQYKIGVVDLKQVFDNYKKQIEAFAKLHKERAEAQEPLDKLQEKIEADKERYDAGKDNMSTEDRSKLEEQINSDLDSHKAERDRAQKALDRRGDTLSNEIWEEIRQGVQELGSRENYHLIFESGAGATRRGGLLYHTTTINMTQRVIDYLNEKYEKQ